MTGNKVNLDLSRFGSKPIMLHTRVVLSAAHHLNDYNGKCNRLHGHSYIVDVWIKGDISKLSNNGLLFDFTRVKELIRDNFDHYYLNDLISVNPTAEILSVVFYNLLKNDAPNLDFKIRVYEEFLSKQWAEFGDW